MRYGFIALLSCLALAVPSLGQPSFAAEPPAAFTAQDSEAIKSVIRHYFQAFTAKDYAAFGDYFTAPFVLVGRQPQVLPTIEDVIRTWRGIRAPLDHTAYATSKAVEIRVIPMNSERALANIHWQRFKKDGSLLSEGAEFYFVIKRSGQWKIDGQMGQQLALFGK